MVNRCEVCGRPLRPGEIVVHAAEQVGIVTRGDAARPGIDGRDVLVHDRCWQGDTPSLRYRGLGPFRVLARTGA